MQQVINTVVVDADEEAGSKGFFDQTRAMNTVVAFDMDILATKIREFSSAFGGLFSSISASEAMNLEQIELSIELTAKGEIRLIAAGSIETKGAVKLTFKRK